MSSSAVAAFFRKSQEQEDLRIELARIQEVGAETEMAEVVALAARHGFTFSAVDFLGAVEQGLVPLHDAAARGELGEAALSQVAGGIGGSLSSVIFAVGYGGGATLQKGATVTKSP